MNKQLESLLDSNSHSMRRILIWNTFHYMLNGIPFAFLYLTLDEIFKPIIDPSLTLNTQNLAMYIGGLVLLTLLHLYISAKGRLLTVREGYKITSDARIKLADHLRSLSLGFFNNRDPGDITAVLLQDMVNIEMALTHYYFEIKGSMILALVSIVSFLIIDWRISATMAITIAIAYPGLELAQRYIKRQGTKQLKARTDAVARMLEYLQGIKEMKAYNLTGTKFKRLDKSLLDLRRESIKLEAFAGPGVMVYGFVLELGFISILLNGTYWLIGGTLTVPKFLLYLVVTKPFFTVIQNIGVWFAELKYSNQAADRITEVINTKPLPEPKAGKKPESFEVEFKNVSFDYGKGQVLKDISFEVPERSFTALVGPSGSGKTTITSLIPRFWDVTGGEVLIGGINIKEMQTEDLLSYISMVFQDVYLFNDTIYNNIKIGKKDATKEEIIEAAQASQCHEFISKLPDGYDTLVGEGGSTLSGGEKQRISIARAILKDAPIVLLDEATASLDPENEIYILKAIDELVKSKTLIVIAHRFATIINADNILVLKDSEIIERGKHEELSQANGLYQRFWEEQQKARGWKFN